MAAGLWVEAAADLSALYPALGNSNAIKSARQRLGTNSNKDTNWKTYPTSRETEEADEMTALAQRFLQSAPHLRLAAYRKTGPGTRPGVAIWDPRVCDDPRASLTAKLGELAVWAEIRWPAPAEAAAAPAPALEPMPAPLPAPPTPVSAGGGYGSGGYGVGVYKGSAGPPDAILTSPHNVSALPGRNVSARALVPRHLLRGASPAILNLGFKPAAPPAWLTGGRR